MPPDNEVEAAKDRKSLGVMLISTYKLVEDLRARIEELEKVKP